MSGDEDTQSKDHDEEYARQTWLEIPKYMAGFVIGKGGRNLKDIKKKTETEIETSNNGDITYFIIEGDPHNQYNAKVKLKKLAHICKNNNKGLYRKWFTFIDANSGIFELLPCGDQIYRQGLRLSLQSSSEDQSQAGNYDQLLEDVQEIVTRNQENNRTSNVWCHFGKVHIDYGSLAESDDKEYSLSEVVEHVIHSRKCRSKFAPGFSLNEREVTELYTEWFPLRYQKCVPYERSDFTFCTPSFNELRLKIFIVVDDDSSTDLKTVYKSSKCPHEMHSVIKSSDSPPYFYICDSTPKTALVNIFEPSEEVDIRLITEAICTEFQSGEEGDLYDEAMTLYEYVKNNLYIDDGKAILPEYNFPNDYDHTYSRASPRENFSFSIEGVEITAQLSYEYEFFDNACRMYWGIHLSSDDCNNITPEQVPDKVPKLLNYAKNLARAVSKSVRNQQTGTIPTEIIARGPKAQSAYLTALKSGKVKNCRVPIVVVGQSRSGKTSLLRSLHREKFNPSEDSTIGAKLQRSLSKAEDANWEKNEIDENVVYNRCAAIAMMPHLLKADSMDSDDDYHDDYELYNENFIPEENIVNDSLETHQEEDKALPLKEDLKTANEQTTEKDFTKSITSEVHPKQLPEEVASFAKDILENPDSAKQMEKDLFLHTMDFAGQPVYSVTHPVFLPPKGIFLLVHNLENDLHAKATSMVKCGAAERTIDDHCPMTNMDHLEFWLSLVAANSTLEGGSLVFVVSTHADRPFQPDVKQTARQILHSLKREDFVPGSHVVRGIYTVDNTVSGSGRPDDPGVQRLKVDLSKEARSLPQLNEDIPIRWFLFEKRLMSLVKEEKKKYILHEEAEKIAIECEVDLESDELGTLLDYLHDLKVIIYFPETDMIIIDTQWLLDMFSKVITVQPIECHHKGFESDWKKLEEHGMINVNFLEHLWCDLLDDNASLQSLADIMEKFSLICKWRQLDGGTSFLVPAMLMNTSADNANQLIADNLAFPLVIRFDSSHLPFAIFTRLLVLVEKMCNSKWPGASQPHLSKNFARFYIVDGKFSSSLVFTSDVQTITVALFNDKTRGNRDCFFVKLSTWLTEFLERTLKNMMESFPWMKRLEFAFGIRCPVCKDAASCKKHDRRACPRDSCLHFVSKQELLSTTQMRCNRSPTKQDNVIPDSSFSHWFHRKDDNAAKVKETQEQFQVLSLASGSTEDGDVCKEVIAAANQNSKIISSDKVTTIAKRIADVFNLDKHSTTTIPEETIHKCRTNCRWLVTKGGEVFVEALRKELPSGMTGPLKFGYGVKVCDMDSAAKLQFSEALSGKKMEWKAFAKEKVGLSHYRIEYLHERLENPVLAILNEDCRDWSVEELYNAVADIGADAVADDFL